MKFLQLISNYEGYLIGYNERLRERGATWEHAQALYYEDGFLMPHFLSTAFRALGHEANFVVFNNNYTQQIWELEYSSSRTKTTNEILLEQIAYYDPDILYVMDPITLDSSFLRAIKRRSMIIIGWRAAPIHPSIDFSEFDFIFSSVPDLFTQMRAQGAEQPRFFLPGVDVEFMKSLPTVEKQADISFSGQYGPLHVRRNMLLLNLAQQQLKQRDNFELAYYLATSDYGALPAGVFAHCRPPVWGRNMLSMYASSRAAFHIPIDMAEANATAMRLFEVGATGTPLFVHRSAEIQGVFSEDEVIRFDDANDFIQTYLKLRCERDALEERGLRAMKRCMNDHSTINRALQLLEICR